MYPMIPVKMMICNTIIGCSSLHAVLLKVPVLYKNKEFQSKMRGILNFICHQHRENTLAAEHCALCFMTDTPKKNGSLLCAAVCTCIEVFCQFPGCGSIF